MGVRGNTAKHILQGAWLAAGTLLIGAAAWAQETGVPGAMGRPRLTLLEGVISTLLFGVVGIVLAVVGFKLFDMAIRHSIEHEVFEHKNVAAALLAGSVVLGISLIVAATILS